MQVALAAFCGPLRPPQSQVMRFDLPARERARLGAEAQRLMGMEPDTSWVPAEAGSFVERLFRITSCSCIACNSAA